MGTCSQRFREGRSIFSYSCRRSRSTLISFDCLSEGFLCSRYIGGLVDLREHVHSYQVLILSFTLDLGMVIVSYYSIANAD